MTYAANATAHKFQNLYINQKTMKYVAITSAHRFKKIYINIKRLLEKELI